MKKPKAPLDVALVHLVHHTDLDSEFVSRMLRRDFAFQSPLVGKCDSAWDCKTNIVVEVGASF